MAEQRLHARLDCEGRCHLHVRDSFYSATVKNFSMGGALVYFDDTLPNVLVGGDYNLSLDGNLLCVFDCKVVGIETSNVALRFIGMDW